MVSDGLPSYIGIFYVALCGFEPASVTDIISIVYDGLLRCVLRELNVVIVSCYRICIQWAHTSIILLSLVCIESQEGIRT
jgi:hypothetical protein